MEVPVLSKYGTGILLEDRVPAKILKQVLE